VRSNKNRPNDRNLFLIVLVDKLIFQSAQCFQVVMVYYYVRCGLRYCAAWHWAMSHRDFYI